MGICYEHSVAEGIAVVALVTDVAKKLEEEEQNTESSGFVPVDDSCWRFKVSKLEFPASDEEIRGRIGEAKDEFKT